MLVLYLLWYECNQLTLTNNGTFVVVGYAPVAERLRNVVATVAVHERDLFNYQSDGKNYCGYFDGFLNTHYTLIPCGSSMPGQFVQILLSGERLMLNIYEVEVHRV